MDEQHQSLAASADQAADLYGQICRGWARIVGIKESQLRLARAWGSPAQISAAEESLRVARVEAAERERLAWDAASLLGQLAAASEGRS